MRRKSIPLIGNGEQVRHGEGEGAAVTMDQDGGL